jgi:hypothetical protein
LRDFEVIKEFGSTVGDGTIYICRADRAGASAE